MRELPIISDRHKTKGVVTGRTPIAARNGRYHSEEKSICPITCRIDTVRIRHINDVTLKKYIANRTFIIFL